MLPISKRITTKKQLKEVLEIERARYAVPLSWLRDFVCLTSQDILRKHSYLLRVAEYHTNAKHLIRSLFYKIRLRRLQTKYGIYIPLNTCEKGLWIAHLAPVFINPNCEIGPDVYLYPFCGAVAKGFSNEAPKLGKGVVLCMGSVIIGGITIADDVVVGANAVVTKNITEKNISVAGAPAQKITGYGREHW